MKDITETEAWKTARKARRDRRTMVQTSILGIVIAIPFLTLYVLSFFRA